MIASITKRQSDLIRQLTGCLGAGGEKVLLTFTVHNHRTVRRNLHALHGKAGRARYWQAKQNNLASVNFISRVKKISKWNYSTCQAALQPLLKTAKPQPIRVPKLPAAMKTHLLQCLQRPVSLHMTQHHVLPPGYRLSLSNYPEIESTTRAKSVSLMILHSVYPLTGKERTMPLSCAKP